MSRILVLSTVVICGLIVRNAAAQPPELVGEWGTSDKIEFIGLKTISKQEICDALGGNFKMIVASHPQGKFQHYLDQLHRHIESGFRASGFLDVTLNVKYDAERAVIVADVDEGIRYLNGRIDIDGAIATSPDRIREFLTQGQVLRISEVTVTNAKVEIQSESRERPALRKKTVLWTTGKPASSSAFYRRNLKSSISQCFERIGYYHSDSTVEIRPERDGTATLVVTIQKEGPQSVLGRVEIDGNSRDSHREIVQYLGITPGMPLNSTLIDELRQKLRASARFAKQSIDILDSDNGPDSSVLKLTLVENPKAPPLKDEFSPGALAALQVGKWIEGLSDSDDDLVAEAQWTITGDFGGNVANSLWKPFRNRFGAGAKNDGNQPNLDDKQRTFFAKIVFSPRRGKSMFQFRILQHPETMLFDATMTLHNKQLILDSAVSKVRCELATSTHHFVGGIQIVSTPPDREGRMSQIMFGLGIEPDTSTKPVVKLTCDPASVIYNFEKLKEMLQLDEDRLVFASDDFNCSFDAHSGRLQNCSSSWGQDPKVKFKLESGPGLCDEIFNEHQAAATDYEVMRLDQAPFACLIAFLAGNNGQASGAEATESRTRLRGLAERWRQHERPNAVLDHRDEMGTNESSPNPFFIPLDSSSTDGKYQLYEYAYHLTSRLIPKQSSTWTILREFAFISMGQTQHSNAVLTSIFKSADCGPVANLIGSSLFGLFNPILRIEFAKRGLQKLTVQDFQTDYRPFLNDQEFAGRSLISLGSLLGECNEQEKEALVNLLSLEEGPARNTVIQSLSRFSKRNGHNPIEAISAALDDLWLPLIRPQVESLLNEYQVPQIGGPAKLSKR